MVNSARQPLWMASGLAAGPLGWMLHQQLLSALEHFDCHYGGGWWGFATGILIGIPVLFAGIAAWRMRRHASSTRRFLGSLGAFSAAVFLFAILLQTSATLVVPVCAP